MQSDPETRNIRFLFNHDDYAGGDPEALRNVRGARRGEMLYAEWMRKTFVCQLSKQQFTPAIVGAQDRTRMRFHCLSPTDYADLTQRSRWR